MKKKEVYIFIFTGEFGYELLNWQGRIRKFSKNNPDAIICVASKEECEIFYRDFSSQFISISNLKEYEESYSDRYFSHSKNYFYRNVLSEITDAAWAFNFRKKLKKYVNFNLQESIPPNSRKKFIFSDKSFSINDYQFGAARTRFSRLLFGSPQTIYHDIPFNENIYTTLLSNLIKSDCDVTLKSSDSDKPIAVIQTASRNRIIRSTDNISEREMLLEFAKDWEVILLEYESTRFSDTQGIFEQSEFHSIKFRNLAEQVALLSQADICISFTHGDFRSNTYVPAVIGRQSFVIASPELLTNSAIDIWNEFVFSGEIVPITISPTSGTQLAIQQIKEIRVNNRSE